MSAYLQRLLDRAAPAAPDGGMALPAGPSLSPVAQADQRLNDADRVGRLGFASWAQDAADAGDLSLWAATGDTPQPSGTGAYAEPARSGRPPGDLSSPDAAHADSTAGRDAPPRRPRDDSSVRPAESPSARSPQPWFPTPVGAVFSDDWVRDEPSSMEGAQAAAQADASSRPSSPRADAQAGAVTDAAASLLPTAKTQEALSPPGARLPAGSAPADLAPFDDDASGASQQPVATPGRPVHKQARFPRDDTDRPSALADSPQTHGAWAEPPAPRIPALAPDAASALMEVSVRNAREADPSRPSAPVSVSLPQPPASRPPARPLSAHEASVIGSLPVRRRALTLFGLRRR